MILKNEKINVQNSISEFSIYGIILTNEKNLYINKSVSFLVRTKNKDDLEGGVMEGAGAIDIPYLVDIKLESNLSKKVEITAEEIQKYLDDLKAAEEAKKKEEEEKKKAEEEAKKKEEEEAKKKEEEAKNNEGDANKNEENKSELYGFVDEKEKENIASIDQLQLDGLVHLIYQKNQMNKQKK